MKLDDIYPNKYLKASDLPEEGSQGFTIGGVEVEEIGPSKDKKPVISFQETDKTLVCNKTNWKTIVKVLGSDDSDDWFNKKVNLYRAEVDFQGEMVEAIRVSLKQPKTAGKNPERPELDEDDIPF